MCTSPIKLKSFSFSHSTMRTSFRSVATKAQLMQERQEEIKRRANTAAKQFHGDTEGRPMQSLCLTSAILSARLKSTLETMFTPCSLFPANENLFSIFLHLKKVRFSWWIWLLHSPRPPTSTPNCPGEPLPERLYQTRSHPEVPTWSSCRVCLNCSNPIPTIP